VPLLLITIAIFFVTSTVAFLLVFHELGRHKLRGQEGELRALDEPKETTQTIQICKPTLYYKDWKIVPFGVVVLDGDGYPIWKKTTGVWQRLGSGDCSWLRLNEEQTIPGSYPYLPKGGSFRLLLTNIPDTASLQEIVAVARVALAGGSLAPKEVLLSSLISVLGLIKHIYRA